jgi:THO complex subunit 1
MPLKLADSLFRRQILMQLMITLQYLQLLTKAEKTKWHPPKNRSFLTDFVLEQPETTWVLETWSKTMAEIRATAPLGKEFADAASGILQRERNWVIDFSQLQTVPHCLLTDFVEK